MLVNAGDGLNVPQIHNGDLVGVHGVKSMKDFDLFKYERQIFSLRQKKPSKQMYFEQNFNAKIL